MNESKSASTQNTATKVDLKKQFKQLYNPPTKEVVPALSGIFQEQFVRKLGRQSVLGMKY